MARDAMPGSCPAGRTSISSAGHCLPIVPKPGSGNPSLEPQAEVQPEAATEWVTQGSPIPQEEPAPPPTDSWATAEEAPAESAPTDATWATAEVPAEAVATPDDASWATAETPVEPPAAI